MREEERERETDTEVKRKTGKTNQITWCKGQWKYDLPNRSGKFDHFAKLKRCTHFLSISIYLSLFDSGTLGWMTNPIECGAQSLQSQQANKY